MCADATTRCGANAAKLPHMAGEPLRILLIQRWIIPADGVRTRLTAAGYLPLITRVDFEAALEAALWRGGLDLIIVAKETPGLPSSTVESRMREYGCTAPLVELGDFETLCERIRAALATRRN